MKIRICSSDHCSGPIDIEDCTGSQELCKLFETKADYYDSVKNYNYQASLNLEGYTTDWSKWIQSQIEQEGLEKYQEWYARMGYRCDLHPDLVEAHNKLFKTEEK